MTIPMKMNLVRFGKCSNVLNLKVDGQHIFNPGVGEKEVSLN